MILLEKFSAHVAPPFSHFLLLLLRHTRIYCPLFFSFSFLFLFLFLPSLFPLLFFFSPPCQVEYKCGAEVYEMCMTSFDALPLAAIMNKQVCADIAFLFSYLLFSPFFKLFLSPFFQTCSLLRSPFSSFTLCFSSFSYHPLLSLLSSSYDSTSYQTFSISPFSLRPLSFIHSASSSAFMAAYPRRFLP